MTFCDPWSREQLGSEGNVSPQGSSGAALKFLKISVKKASFLHMYTILYLYNLSIFIEKSLLLIRYDSNLITNRLKYIVIYQTPVPQAKFLKLINPSAVGIRYK